MTTPTPPQREVVQRLEAAGTSERLSELVLSTPVGGRGQVDPEAVSVDGMLRVCVSTLARWCAVAAPLPAVAARRARRHRPWHPSFVVVGGSPHAASVRASLLAAGYVEGGRRPHVLLVTGPVEALVAEHWRGRVRHGAGRRWRRQWFRLAGRGQLPPDVDPTTHVDRWALPAAAERLHVLAYADPAAAVREAAAVLGLDQTSMGPPPEVRGADVVDTDLLRRLNQLLATRAPAVRSRPLDGDLSRAFTRPWTPGLGVPVAQMGWALEQAERVAASLASGPGVLHGDPRVVVPSSEPVSRSVDPAGALDRALEVLTGLGGGSWHAR